MFFHTIVELYPSFLRYIGNIGVHIPSFDNMPVSDNVCIVLLCFSFFLHTLLYHKIKIL